MGKLPDLDFLAEIKRSRKNRKHEYKVVDKFKELSDSRWWSFDESNVFGGSTIIFNTRKEVKLHPVILGLHQDLYHVQFAVKNDGLTFKALNRNHSSRINDLVKHATEFNLLNFDGSMPSKISLRLNSKQYLKFINNLHEESAIVLESKGLESSKENICLLFTLTFLLNNYSKYYELDCSEEEFVEDFFARFKAGLTPEVALATIVDGISYDSALKYAGVPALWVEEATGLDCKVL